MKKIERILLWATAAIGALAAAYQYFIQHMPQ